MKKKTTMATPNMMGMTMRIRSTTLSVRIAYFSEIGACLGIRDPDAPLYDDQGSGIIPDP